MSQQIDLKSLTPGDVLPDIHVSPVSRTTLALFAGGSADHNPMHIDSDFAKMFGFEDVFVHGMLSMAYLGQLLTRYAPPEKLRHWHVRFTSITPAKTGITLSGKVTDRKTVKGEERVLLEVRAQTEKGVETVSGTAEIAI